MLRFCESTSSLTKKLIMKKEVKHLYNKAIDSLILSIELFNRPSDCARVHGTLIFMDHSFEMLLKASIIHKGGKIKEKDSKETLGFNSCVNKAYSDEEIKFLKNEEVLIVKSLNCLRDAAQHYTLEMAEQHLYFQAQAGLTLFRDITNRVFQIDLKTKLPTRVLPLSTTPPMDIQGFFNVEIREVKKLLQSKSRKKLNALEKLRAFIIMEKSIQGSESQPSEKELNKIAMKLKNGSEWEQVFPGVSTLSFTTNGYGPSLDLRIEKKGGSPVHIVPEGTPGATIIAIKRVNELDFYTLNLTALCDKIKIQQHKLLAVIKEIKLQENSDAFKCLRIGSAHYNRYSPMALDILKKELPNLDIDEIWQRNKPIRKQKNAKIRAVA